MKHPSLLGVAFAGGLAALVGEADQVCARNARTQAPVEQIQSRIPGEPVIAVVSLNDQRITVYDAAGWILRAPVSSGQKGRETPAGIFSVIQKDAEHYSNLYDDAYMPHMQRLTWSGIALHGGPLPGYPASHGCVRMPYDFAERLFNLTRLGMRVIVVPDDPSPVDIVHPALFPSKPGIDALAATRAAEAQEAGRKAAAAKAAAATASRDVERAKTAARLAENLKQRAEEQLAAAEKGLGSAASDKQKERAADTRDKAAARLEQMQAQLTAASAELQAKLDALTSARETSDAAEAGRMSAAESARELARALQPLSVFISRKAQRLYVRRGFVPVLEIAVTIREPERPIGTHVFTAVAEANGESGIRWSVVSLDAQRAQRDLAKRGAAASEGAEIEEGGKESSQARSALERIVIPPEVARLAEMASPRSSLIISDEELSAETGRGTDFIVLLDHEPQGGARRGQRSSELRYLPASLGLPFARTISRN